MNKMIGKIAALIVAMTSGSLAHAETVAITGGRVITGADAGTIEGGTVVITDGKITAVGANVSVPSSARIIDASGQWVTTGLMAPATQIGVNEVSLEGATTDHTINSGSPFSGQRSEAPFSAAFDIAPGINPNSVLIPISRMEGLTRAAVLPGVGKAIFGGQAALIQLGGGYDVVTDSGVAMKMKYGSGGGGNMGGARGAAMVYLEAALGEAADYARRGKKALANRERDSMLSEADAAALGRVVSGEMLLLVDASRASDLLHIVALKEKFSDLRVAVIGAQEGWMVADELATAGIAVIVDATANLPSSFDAIGSTMSNAGRLDKAGVLVSLCVCASGHNARLVPQIAGNAVANGMDWDAALRAITINTARIFGIDDSFGTLERGKDADVVVWDGDPLEVMSSPTAVFIRGEQMVLESRQTKLRDRYQDLGGDTPHAYRK